MNSATHAYRPGRLARLSVRSHRSAARWGSAIAPVVAALIAPGAHATDHYWQAFNANWNTPADWNTLQAGGGLTGVPLANDNANILFNDNFTRTVAYVNPGFVASFSTVSIDNVSTGASILSQAQDVLGATNENFGVGGNGALVMSAGTNNAVNLALGVNAGGKGTVTLSGAAVMNLGNAATGGAMYVGQSGSGAFTQNGGAVTFAGTSVGSLYLGANTGSTGTYNLQSGALSVSGNFNTSEYVGNLGTGIFNQSGGSNTAAQLYVGYQAASGSAAVTGTYNMTGGTLTTAGETIGLLGNGTFNQSNGAHIVNANLYLSLGGGTGTYNMSGGTLVGTYIEFLGYRGAGIFNQSGGTHTANGLLLADNPNGISGSATATYSLSNGATLNVNFSETIGFGGTGNFIQTGGTHNIFGSGNPALALGYLAGVTGNFTLQGGNLQVSGGPTYVGYGGAGNFTQSGGTHTSSSLLIGMNAGSSGTYTLNAGNLFATSEQVGNTGNAIFTQAGGAHSVANDLTVGQSGGSPITGNATFNLQGGTLNVGGYLSIGTLGFNQMNQSGGTATVGTFQLGVNVPGASGNYSLSGGTLNVNTTEYLGSSGSANFTQTGGINNFGSFLIVGFGATGSGYYSLGPSGTINSAGSEYIGYFGNGTLYQSGGTNNTASVTLGSAPGASGNYVLFGSNSSANITGGLILGGAAASGTSAAATGTFNLSGGSVTASSEIDGYYGVGTVSQAGGNQTLGTLLVGFASSGIGAYSLTFGTLNVTGTEVIGNLGAGTFTQSGGNHTVGGLLTTAQNFGSTGSFALSGGSLTAPVLNNGLFVQSGGSSYNGAFTNNGTFNFNSPSSFNGSLVQSPSGIFNANSNVSINVGGITNGGTINVPTGASLTLNALPLDNEGGTINLNGGALGGSGAIVNNGVIAGFGSITGGGAFTNNGLLNQGAGNIVLGRFGAMVNNGAINAAAGRQIQLNANLINAASINLNGGFIAGSQPLTNQSGGQIIGPGTVSAPLGSNAGTLIAQSGPLSITQPFANTGAIQLGGLSASLLGGALNNGGTIQGLGAVNNALDNTGTVEPIGGTLALAGAVTNEAAGVFRAAVGNKLLITGALGPNLGAISLTGGTVDTNGHPLVNNNTISGFGTLATGGLTNSGGAQMTFSGGLTTVNGAVSNLAGGTIRVIYNPAIFTHPVTNSGTFKITATTVTFAAPFTNNGLYTSDPATTRYTDLTIGKAGALAGGVGDKFFVSGDLHNSSTQAATWDTADGAELHFNSGGNPAHVVTLTGADLGPNALGYQHNFAWGIVALDAGQSLNLSDGDTTPGGALYTSILQLAGAPTDGTLPAFIAGHLMNASSATPMDIYYDAAQPANAYLGGSTYALGNGGVLAAVTGVPEPTAVGLAIASAAIFSRRKRRR